MSRYRPKLHPVDESSDLHKLALEIEASMHAAMRAFRYLGDDWKAGRARVSACVGALAALGYRDWFVAAPAYLDAGRPGRRAQVIDRCKEWPWQDRFRRALEQVGYRPPRRDAGRRADPLDAFVRIDGEGAIEWGLEETRGRELACWAFDRLVLKVLDGSHEVARTASESLTFINYASLAALHLTDDDYRFEIRIESAREGRRVLDGVLHFVGAPDPGMGVPSNGYWVDMAVVDGAWQEIGFQGREWDGEHGDTGIVHVVTEEAAAARAEAAKAKQERDEAFVRERAERKARQEAERKAAEERRERERIGRLVAKGMASAGLKAKYDAMVAEAEAEVAAEAEAMAGVTVESVIAEAEGHIAHFTSRNHPEAAVRWQSVVDRIAGEGGISDADLATWLAEAKAGGWRRGLQTLPKVIAVLDG